MYVMGLRVKKGHNQDVLGHHSWGIVQLDCHNGGIQHTVSQSESGKDYIEMYICAINLTLGFH